MADGLDLRTSSPVARVLSHPGYPGRIWKDQTCNATAQHRLIIFNYDSSGPSSFNAVELDFIMLVCTTTFFPVGSLAHPRKEIFILGG